MLFISSLSAFPEFLLTFFTSSHNAVVLSPLCQHVGESLEFHTLLPPPVPVIPMQPPQAPTLCGITWNNWNNVYFLTYRNNRYRSI